MVTWTLPPHSILQLQLCSITDRNWWQCNGYLNSPFPFYSTVTLTLSSTSWWRRSLELELRSSSCLKLCCTVAEPLCACTTNWRDPPSPMVRPEPEAEPDAELDTTKPGNSKYRYQLVCKYYWRCFTIIGVRNNKFECHVAGWNTRAVIPLQG